MFSSLPERVKSRQETQLPVRTGNKPMLIDAMQVNYMKFFNQLSTKSRRARPATRQAKVNT